MPCPWLPEEGGAGWSPLQPNGTQRCWLRKGSGLPWHPNCCQVTLVWEVSAVLPFPCVCRRAGCDVTQLLLHLPGKTRCESKAQACWAGFGVPPPWVGADRALSSSSGFKGSEGPLGISSARVKHRPAGLRRHLPQQV